MVESWADYKIMIMGRLVEDEIRVALVSIFIEFLDAFLEEGLDFAEAYEFKRSDLSYLEALNYKMEYYSV